MKTLGWLLFAFSMVLLSPTWAKQNAGISTAVLQPSSELLHFFTHDGFKHPLLTNVI